MNAQELVAPVAADITRLADQAERERKLPDELMASLRRARIFSIYTPKQFGGMGLALVDALQIVEEVSRLDGSTGWVVSLGFANDLFTSVIDQQAAAKVFEEDAFALIAGSPGFNMRAAPVEGGYEVSGQWAFASGAPNAKWVNAAVPVFDGDKPRMTPYGMPEMIMTFMKPHEAEIVEGTWDVLGLRASGSFDLRVDKVFVAKEFAGPFSVMGAPTQRECALARVPLFTALSVMQAPPVCLGIARHAITAFCALAAEKERPPAPKLIDQTPAQIAVAKAEAKLRSARLFYYEAAREMWDTASASRPVTPELQANVRLAVLTAAENSVEIVDSLYRLAGSSSIFQRSPLERCFRDVHTASQHMASQAGRWETAGQVLLGLTPNSPIV
jgi:indole-3-acetate monooxygenase